MVRVSHQSDEGSEVTELTNQTDQSDALPDGLLGYGGSGQEHGSGIPLGVLHVGTLFLTFRKVMLIVAFLYHFI